VFQLDFIWNGWVWIGRPALGLALHRADAWAGARAALSRPPDGGAAGSRLSKNGDRPRFPGFPRGDATENRGLSPVSGVTIKTW